MTGALGGLKVLDLSRILAGPFSTQLLADMGAEVLKIENPRTAGDDTRQWGPPFVEQMNGDQDLSAYFISANRGKRSVAIDFGSREGQIAIKKLAKEADILVENFKSGSLKAYGLDYESLKEINAGLIYCSITGFGQVGANSDKPGYDLMAQAYGGIMSLTGDAAGPPMKTGVAIADVVCGLYASSGILAALHHRNQTGEGQHIDLALVDSQIAWLVNQGSNYLVTGEVPERLANAHPTIVPYEVFKTLDGFVVIAVGNDKQFANFSNWLDQPQWIGDERYRTNPLRLKNRTSLVSKISSVLSGISTQEVLIGLEKVGVPVGPVNSLDQVFESDQVREREMRVDIESPHVVGGAIPVVGNPLKFSKTPVIYNMPPPKFGEHTTEVMSRISKEEEA